MPFHGETNRQIFKIIASHESGPVHSVVMQATLSLAQEVLSTDDRAAGRRERGPRDERPRKPALCGPADFLGRARCRWSSVYGREAKS